MSNYEAASIGSVATCKWVRVAFTPVESVWKCESRSLRSGSLIGCTRRVNSEEEAVEAGRLAPSTEIPGTGGATVGDFWAWAYSEILTNTSRAIFAEFLVGNALRVVERVRPAGRTST